jgi:hypothetical protein
MGYPWSPAQLEPKKTDVRMLHWKSPRLGEMLCEDDWFDKMSAAGRDHLRFGYMQQLLAYTEKQKRAILAGAGAQTRCDGLRFWGLRISVC